MRRFLITGLLILGGVAEGHAGSPRMAPRGPEAGPPTGIGCYWHRGRSYCGRHCYIEVDGARYCVERQRDAHSQAPAELLFPSFPAPIK